jgi:anti-sigma regulatory factor (Ser/Thr protein kinase)
VILYTDGIVERPGRSLDEGFADLRGAVAGAGPAGAEELCDAILAGTLGGAAETADDVTVVVAHSARTLGPRVELAVPGRPDALVGLRATLRRWLAEQTAAQPVVAEVTMATNEAVQNAIEHAHGLGGAPFEVELERDGADVVVSVRDHGRWHEGVPGDRGRGLPLMRALMDDVRVDSQPQGTTVVMRRRIVSELTSSGGVDVR